MVPPIIRETSLPGTATRIIPVYKSNGGQASALNAGFAASRGDIVVFLDADDLIVAVGGYKCRERHSVEPGISNVHWSMWVIDASGNRDRRNEDRHSRLPRATFASNCLSLGLRICRARPRRAMRGRAPSSSGASDPRGCSILSPRAPTNISIHWLPRSAACERSPSRKAAIASTDRNIYSSRTFREKLDLELEGYEQQCRALSATLRSQWHIG